MLRRSKRDQIEIFEFEHPFENELDSENRWVKLSKLLPWDELVSIYSSSMSKNKGRYGIEGRLAVGSLIIKHKLGLSDREVIETLKENIYLQYFVGFKRFKKESAFDASLFVELRKRMGVKNFDLMNQAIIKKYEEATKNKVVKKRINNDGNNTPPTSSTDNTSLKENPNKGKLKIDATISDQMIAYPTDLGLLNTARQESERLIDKLYEQTDLRTKPRTYRRNARKDYLSVSKKRNTKSNRQTTTLFTTEYKTYQQSSGFIYWQRVSP